MASNSIKIFDDSVIKLSVNQGLEPQRIAEVLGNFTNGELAFTRDTGRLFVGDNSDGEEGHVGLQETLGGTLVGNKYLGLIDSKPLAPFADNGKPLSYEEITTYTGTQENATMQEKGLLTKDSKFMLHSSNPQWDNWDRTAIYNEKYHAYNGDFMYDLYQNALILFDTRISGKEEAESQPRVKMNGSGEESKPVEPETFLVKGDDGQDKEVASNTTDALSLTRRTKLINYIKENDKETNFSEVYGDGYVILRMVEPDNQTVRFKPRKFQNNGLPEGENNYSHNILEVFHVPTSAILGSFSDDFYESGEIIYLNKDIMYVKSITGDGGRLKIPGNLCFSTAKTSQSDLDSETGKQNNGKEKVRGATTYMEWDIKEPSKDITVNKATTDEEQKKYRLKLTPKSETTEDNKKYIKFDGELEEIVPCSYTINLKGNLFSDQHNKNTLVIDKQATDKDIQKCPTLEFIPPDPEIVLGDEEDDPYMSDTASGDFYYSGNLGFDGEGRVRYIDTFDPETLGTSFDKINKWEEVNTSVNYLKTPVTIAQSSSSTQLYEAIGNVGATSYTVNGNQKLEETKVDSSIINYNHEALIEKVTSFNQLVHANDRNAAATVVADNKVSFANSTLTIPTINGQQGIAVAVSGQKININTHIESIKFKGRVLGLVGYSGNCKVFGALVYNTSTSSSSSKPEIISCRILEEKYANFLFELDLDVQEVLMKDNCYLVTGIICDTAAVSGTYPAITNVTVKYDAITIRSVNSLSAEKMFVLSDVGVNVNLDYNTSPYLYCAKKIVSCPYGSILPKPTNTTFPGTSNSSSYFTIFNNSNGGKTYIKSWNDLFKVLGKNHFKDASDNTKSNIIVDYTSKYNTSGAGFKYIDAYEWDETNKNIKTHTDVNQDSNEGYMAFCWYKEYSKGTNSNTESDVKYYPQELFETRNEITLEEHGNYITYAKTSDGKYLFGGNNGSNINSGQIKEGSEETIQKQGDSATRYRKKCCIYIEAADLANTTYIEYGDTASGIKALYDFRTEKNLMYSYSIYVDEEVKAIILANGSTTSAKEISDPKVSQTINVDAQLSTLHKTNSSSETGKISDYNYMAFKYEVLDDKGQKVNNKFYYEVYNIKKDCQYVTGFTEPTKLTGTYILTENASGGTVTSSATVDETLQEADKVYIPTTARNIILEVTHVTTENNTVGMFYANKFDDLAILHSGYPTKEWPDPAHFSTDLVLNPSYEMPFIDGKYTNSSSTYKLTLGKSISSQTNNAFHKLESTPASSDVPSAYSSAPNEKCLMNTSATETRVIEVPLHKIPGSDTRHFALRFANVRPSNKDILNQLVVRVIGYRC